MPWLMVNILKKQPDYIQKMPTALISTPESMAEIGEGADESASGSQAWKGIIAAFSPNPHRRNICINK
jgi:hypothetical protein